MKKIFLPLLLVLFSFNSYSQFKGNPGKAKSSLDKKEPCKHGSFFINEFKFQIHNILEFHFDRYPQLVLLF